MTYSEPTAPLTAPPGSWKSEPSNFNEKSLIDWLVSCQDVESVSSRSSAGEVRLEPAGFQTSMAFAVVSGKLVTAVVVPAIDGVVGLPLALVVPLSARLAQLVQSTPRVCNVLWFCPIVAPRVPSQSPPNCSWALGVTMKVLAPAWLSAPRPSKLSASKFTVSVFTPGGPWKKGLIWPAPPGGLLPGP